MNKIKKLSKILKYIFYGLLIAYPLFEIIFWLNPVGLFMNGEEAVMPRTGFMFGFGETASSGTKIFQDLTWSDRIIGFMVQLIPNLLTIAVLYCLAKLFALYEEGKIFVVSSSQYLKKIGFLLLISNLVRPLVFSPLLQLAITTNNPAKEFFISVTLGTSDLHDIFMSLLVILVSWIMTEACKINEEQKLTV